MTRFNNIDDITYLTTTFKDNNNIQSVDFQNMPIKDNSMIYAFSNCTSLVSVTNINDNVTNISGTFKDCSSLVNVPAIPNSVISMYETFRNCTSLVNVPAIPNSVTNMLGTFAGCVNLVNVPAIPNSVTYMALTFDGCTSLVNAPTISNSVTIMGYAFQNCTSLVNAPIIPNSVTTMGYAFSGCMNLAGDIIVKSQNVSGTVGMLDHNGTNNPAKEKRLYVPYTYENGVNTITYNSVQQRGWVEEHNYDYVELRDLNKKDTMMTVTINPTPSDATVTLTAEGYTQSGNSITIPYWSSALCTVSKDGYHTSSEYVIANETKTIDISLTETTEPYYTLLTKNGDIAISNEGIASGFSSTNYLTTSRLSLDVGDMLYMKIHTPTEFTSPNQLIIFNSTFQLLIYPNGQIGTYGGMSGFRMIGAVKTDTDYYIKMSMPFASRFYLAYSENCVDWKSHYYNCGSATFGDTFMFGQHSNMYNQFKGTMDLKNMYVKSSDGTIKFRAFDYGELSEYTYTVYPTPSDATVTLTAEGYTQSGNSITVLDGTEVTYTVSNDGYKTSTESVVVTSDTNKSVFLKHGGNLAFVKVGNPTLSEAGIASDFSGQNYFTTDKITLAIGNTYYTKIHTPSSFNTGLNYGNQLMWNSNAELVVNFSGKLEYWDSSVGSKYGTTLSTDTDYYIKLQYTNDNIIMGSSVDGTTWNDVSFARSNTPSGTFYVGKHGSAYSAYWHGTMDLYNTYVTNANGTVIARGFSSNVVPTMNFTVVGEPTITNGVVSNFSDANYIRSCREYTEGDTYVLKFTTGSDVSSAQEIAAWKADMFISPYTSKISYWTFNNPIFNPTTANTTYWVKFELHPNGDIFSTSLDGCVWTTPTKQQWSYTAPTYVTFGKNLNNTNKSFKGTIDFSESYVITADGEMIIGYDTPKDTSANGIVNYTIVGSPTVDENGIASGFSGDNYFSIADCLLDTGYEFNTKFNVSATDNMGVLLDAPSDYFQIFMSGTTLTLWSRKLGNKTILSDIAINTDYYLNAKLTSDKVVIRIYNDSVDTTVEYDRNDLIASGEFYLGRHKNGSSIYWHGSIDLSQTYFRNADGEIILSAYSYNQNYKFGSRIDNKATVVGAYTASDGHKYVYAVLDAQYRSANITWGIYGTDTSIPNYATSESVLNARESATSNTDAILNNYTVSNYPAFNVARNAATIMIEGNEHHSQLPNVYELKQIFNNKTILDDLDTSVSSYPAKSLSNWGFGSSFDDVWTSNEYNSEFAWYIYKNGNVDFDYYRDNGTFGVAPIIEIKIS